MEGAVMGMVPVVGIVGGGASGALFAIHLLNSKSFRGRIVLFEPKSNLGYGVAYSTDAEEHILNVPAGRMSAFDDVPDHFVNWLMANGFGSNMEAIETQFVPRKWFGIYLESLLKNAVKNSDLQKHQTFLHIPSEVVAVERTTMGYDVVDAQGQSYFCDDLVLATGNVAPQMDHQSISSLDKNSGSLRLYNNPWNSKWPDGLDGSESVLIIGAGLSMVDCVLSLAKRDHAGPIHVISRRGLLPRTHNHGAAPSMPIEVEELPAKALCLLQWVRKKIVEIEGYGASWVQFFEALRPKIQALWMRLPESEKRRCVRHLLPFWNVHRHRVPPSSMSELMRLQQDAQLKFHTGRVMGIEQEDGYVKCVYKTSSRTSGGSLQSINVNVVVVATGPGVFTHKNLGLLLKDLVAKGIAQIDVEGLGIRVTNASQVIARDGSVAGNLYACGYLTRGAFWEITSIPDIRKQVQSVSQQISRASLIGEPVRSPGPSRNEIVFY